MSKTNEKNDVCRICGCAVAAGSGFEVRDPDSAYRRRGVRIVPRVTVCARCDAVMSVVMNDFELTMSQVFDETFRRIQR